MKKLLKIENLILLTAAGLPLYIVKLNFFGILTNVLDVLQLASISWWFWERKNVKEYALKRIIENKKLFAATGLIFLGLFFSMLVSGVNISGLGILKSWFLLPFLFSLAATDIFTGKAGKILKALYLSVTVTSVIALVYWALGNLTYDGRLEAFFNSPNYLAMYLAPGIIIGTFFLKENKKVFGISLAAVILAFCLTQSYAAWAAVAGALFLTSIFMHKERKRIIIGTLAILMVFVFYQAGTKKWQDIYSPGERSSFSSRIMIWKAAGSIVKDNFIWGIGPGNFQKKYLEYQKFYPPYLEWAVPHPHNVYLAFWAETGLMGLIGFFWLTSAWLRDVLKYRNGETQVILFGIVIYFLLHGLVDTTYFKNDLAVVFWLVVFSLEKAKA